MFENLSGRLNQVFQQLRRRGKLSEDDVDVMPPKGGTLTKDQIAKVKAWIDAGAKFPAGVELADKSKKKKK